MRLLPLICCVAFSLSSCGEDDAASPSSQVQEDLVVASFGPLHSLAVRLSGEDLEVHAIAPPGVDALHFKPGRNLVADVLLKARLIVVNGADAEAWLDTVELPRSRVVVTTAGLKQPLIEYRFTHDHDEGAASGHSHGASGQHEHSGKDPFTWVDPQTYRAQMERLRDALKKAWPQYADGIDERAAELDGELRDLIAKLDTLKPSLAARSHFASERAWNYLARSAGFTLELYETAPDREMTTAEVQALVKRKKGESKALMWWARAPDEATVEALRAAGIESVVFRSGTRLGADEEWIAVARENLERLATALR